MMYIYASLYDLRTMCFPMCFHGISDPLSPHEHCQSCTVPAQSQAPSPSFGRDAKCPAVHQGHGFVRRETGEKHRATDLGI